MNKRKQILSFFSVLLLGLLVVSWRHAAPLYILKELDAKANTIPIDGDTTKALKFLDSLPISFLTGKFQPESHPDFVRLNAWRLLNACARLRLRPG
jgi:hypothetical protein